MTMRRGRVYHEDKVYSGEFNQRAQVAATASALRRALVDRNQPIAYGFPDLNYDGRFIETKLGTDFIKSHQFRNFAWTLRWRGQHVGIETAPTRAAQMNPDEFPGQRRFQSVEEYLAYLDGSTEWSPHDGWGLVGMWRELCRLIPEAAGSRIAHLYPDLRPADEIAADTAAEEVEAVAEPAATETITPQNSPTVQITPRTDLPPEAIRFLNEGIRS